MKNSCIHMPEFVFFRHVKHLLSFIVLAFLFCQPMGAAPSDENQYVLSLELNNKSLKQIFSAIESQCDCVFFYPSDLDLSRTTSISVHNMELNATTLNKIFEKMSLNFSMNGRQIYVTEQTKNRESQKDKANLKISGKVVDGNGEPLIGVSINEVGTNNGATTDVNGNFSLYNVGGLNAKVTFTYVGFVPITITLKEEANLNAIHIAMKEDTKGLEEVVVIGYGAQKKESVVGAITTVKPAALAMNQTRSLSNGLAGQVAGMIAIQRSGEPGYDASEFWIRGINSFGAGTSPLVLVDGIERSLNNISVDEIESFSVLKDASATAVYGVRGANGVIIITTKKGKLGTPKISLKLDYGFSKPTQLPEFVDAAKHMEIVNEAFYLDGEGAGPFTQERIDNTRNKIDPELYPDVNWLDAVTKDFAHNTSASLDVNGGSERLRYSLIASVYTESGIIVTDPSQNYDSGISLQRYNVRSNVDVNLTPSTILTIGIGGYLMNRRSPGTAVNEDTFGTWERGVMNHAFNTVPFAHPIKYSNGYIAGRSDDRYNPWALATQTGYRKYYENNVQSQANLKQDIGKLWSPLEGLEFNATFSFDAYNWHNIMRTKTARTYLATGRDENGELQFQQTKPGQEFLNYSKDAGGNRMMYMETRLNYNRIFGKHGVEGLLLFNLRDYVNADAGSAIYSLPYRNQGLAGRVAYNYDARYFAEFNFGYNGSENFAKGHRYGFFPSIALGWMISNEGFMQPLSDVISKLKIRGSYGLVGNDQLSGRRFAYLSTINSTGGYTFGYNSDYGYGGWEEGDFGVTSLTWEKVAKTNIGIELGLFNCINLQADYFKEHRTDIFMQRKTIPDLGGFTQMPWANFGKVDNEGIDATLEINKKINKDWFIGFRGNFTYAHNTVIEYDESEAVKKLGRARTGRPLNQIYGLIADGLFTEDDFIDPANGVLKEGIPEHYGKVLPGDIKYIDQNNDGKIDVDDTMPIGNPSTPEIIYGFGANLIYKNFDFSVFFQGSGNYSMVIGQGNNYFIPGSGAGVDGQIYANVDDRWTEENPTSNVFWPRLHNKVSENNTQSSTWWLRNASYLRLKNMEIGYTLPKSALSKLYISNLRVYARGSNLLTWAPFDMWDPELGSRDGMKYPTSKTFSLGLEVSF